MFFDGKFMTIGGERCVEPLFCLNIVAKQIYFGGEIAWCRAINRCFFQISRPLEGVCVSACSPKHSFLGGR